MTSTSIFDGQSFFRKSALSPQFFVQRNDMWTRKSLVFKRPYFLKSSNYYAFDLFIHGIQLHTDGCIVAKGYDAISTSARVHALKKVDFPQEGLPTNPINIIFQENKVLNKYL